MAWQVEFRAGVWLPQIEWWLDARFPQKRSFVSHAHSDHVAPHGEILCSAGTSRLMQARMPGQRVEHVLPFEQAEPLTSDTAVTLYAAGHIHGSAQCLLAHDAHGTLLYTGDFKLRRGRSAEPCATPRADLLIMETTFGRPQYVFPPTEQVLRDIADFCQSCLDDGETPVLYGYSLGKSQELLCGLAEAKLPVMLHPQTLRLTRVYEELGIAFPPYREFNAAELASHVVICPPQSNTSSFLRKIARRRTAVVTGWAMDPGAIYRYQCDAAFPLSDHADFPDLLRFVAAVQPKLVLTLHGFAPEFALTLRDRGVEAWAIGQDNQLDLGMSVSRAGLRPAPRDASENKGRSETVPTPGPSTFSRFASVAEQVKATPRKLEKIEHLRAYLAELAPDDAALAAAAGQPLELVREANLLAGNIAEVTRAARTKTLDAIQLRVFNPLQFMLASSEPTAGAILERLAPPVWLEEKYDGIRCQLHKQGDRVELYSRDLKRITGQFPDLASAARVINGDFIGDGELLAWRDGRALPFAELQRRLGRKGDDFFLGAEIPVSISFYDLLWLNGRSLLKDPLSTRRALLECLLSSVPSPFSLLLSPTREARSVLEIEAAFLAARQRGNEGLMAKDPQSIYTPGRRGFAWLKLKKADATVPKTAAS